MSAERGCVTFRIGDTKRSQELSIEEAKLRNQLAALPDTKKFKHDKYFAGDPLFELFFSGTETGAGTTFKYCLGIGRWRQMPYFSLLDFRNLQEERPFTRADRKILNQLFVDAFELMHSEGRFTFFYATRVRPFPVRHIRNSGEIAPVRGMPIFDRYDFTIEAEVPIGAEPQYIYQQNLIRMTDRAYDYWLKRGTLKLGYLSNYFSSLSK